MPLPVAVRDNGLWRGRELTLIDPNNVVAILVDAATARGERHRVPHSLVDRQGAERTETVAGNVDGDGGNALQEFRDRLRAWLDEHPQVLRNMVDVHIHQITNEGVELSLSLFLAASSLAEEIRFREAVNCEILHQAAVLGVDLAPRHLRLVRQKASERSVIESAERQPRAA